MSTADIAHEQRTRLRRALFALGGGAALTAVMVLLFLRGSVRLDVAGLLMLNGAFWAVNLSFAAFVVGKHTLRLRDPGMTLALMLWATLSAFLFLYFVDDGRHLVLMVYLVAMMLGAFRLDVGEYLVVTLSALLLYALVIAALEHLHPSVIDVRDEFVNWLVFFLAMGAFSLLGSEASRLRSQLQRRNEELRQARDAAAIAYQTKSRFLASTSHELRTPLNAILGACEVVDGTRLAPQERDALDRARHAGLHLLSLVNSMIDLSKLETGTVEPRIAPLDLVDELDTVRRIMEPLAHSRGIRFVLDLDPTLERRLQGDAMRLSEVLVHLLHNAIKFTHEGEVRLAAERDPGGGSRVRFSVADTGEGIARERLATLFRPFTATDHGAGSGLGLALCRQLVDVMGGTLDVTSTPGAGSRFSFAVPLAPVSADAAHPPAVPASHRRVLVVDDSPDNRVLLCAFLGDAEIELDEASDGAEGVEMFRERRYDVVLMDMHMPVMGGLEATRAMRAIEAQRGGPRTAILALTADDSVNDRARSIEAGCDDHLVKPISRKGLLAAIAAPRPAAAGPRTSESEQAS